MTALCLIHAFATGGIYAFNNHFNESSNSPPNSIDELLTCRTLDKLSRLTKNSQLNSVSYMTL